MNFSFFRRIMARAKNDAGERIESLRFSVPALRVGVLTYGAGQLQTNNTALDGKPVRLYYPPEAVSDEKFLKSLETAPVVVGGHDSTTNEQNKKIDGWAHNVFFDAIKNAAMLDGVVKGAKEVAYIKGNLGSQGFGASAFVDIYNLKVESGTTPDGQAYDAIADDLRATHVALAPHVRDPENKIKVANAVCVNSAGEMITENAMKEIEMNGKKYRCVREPRGENDYGQWEFFYNGSWHDVISYDIRKQLNRAIAKNTASGDIFNSEDNSMEKAEIAALVRDTVREVITAKNSGDRMDAMEETLKKHGDALNEINEKLAPKKAEGENAAFEGKETKEEESEEKKAEKEGATLENASKPSQALIAAFATALNADFGAKTPTWGELAAMAGIKEPAGAARIAAVNAKYEEMKKSTPALNTKDAGATVEVF